MSDALSLPRLSAAELRAALLARREIALLDVREEDPFAQEHPLFAAQLSAGRIELDAPWRLPRRDVPIAVYDDGDGLAEPAARRLQALGYTRVQLLAGPQGNGLQGWREAGGELFRDVNVPSKAFGELVEHERHTPSLPAEQVKALIDSGADLVVLDVRRFDEYQTMSIPGGTSVPGAELVLHVRDLAPDPATRVVVNCAGRTRSIIGAQSLVNAGIPNPVAALRNGTIGWTLAGFELEHGRQRRFGAVGEAHRAAAREAAQALADRAGARRLDAAGLCAWAADAARTLYRWDVRTPEEYAAGHLPGFGSAPGGQLVQETDVFAAVRGARIVLADGGPASDGVRAPITAHWLAQLGWEVAWLTDTEPAWCTETGAWQPARTDPPAVATLTPAQLAQQLAGAPATGGTLLLDLTTSAQHVKGHIPGAWWVLRSQLPQALKSLPAADRIVLTCGSSALARFAAVDLARRIDIPVAVLEGGNAAWVADGRPLEAGDAQLASPRIDRYRRPYEGTDAPRAAMQAYLDWEFGLVAQLARDGTHGFKVLAAAPAA
jgi:rhodanese-related sulfurtransferase